MESIIFLVIFLVLRAVVSNLLEAQKTQRPAFPKMPEKPAGYPQPPVRDKKPKTIPIEEIKTVEVKPDISVLPLKEESSQRVNDIRNVKLQMQQREQIFQGESEALLSDLFSEENIVRGIILQEILSPPKALMQRYR